MTTGIRSGLIKKINHSPTGSLIIYGLSILLLKGFSLLTIPLYAGFLGPAEYGKLDVVVSVMEIIGLCSSLGLADTLYRFASAGSVAERHNQAATVFGSGLIGSLIVTVLVQFFIPTIYNFFGMTIGVWALRAGMLAATLTGLIELPLAWMRLNERPLWYLSFVAGRSIFQILSTWAMLKSGAGAAAILYATFLINIASLSLFGFLSFAKEGLQFTASGFGNMVHYGLPLVGGGLAMYVLGTLDRLFLVKAVSASDIGNYAVAAKLALATALFVQPLALWWYPKRLGVLAQPDGWVRNAEIWNIGFTILMAGASFTALAMPLFIHFSFALSYMPALKYLPWLIVASVLNELVSLSSGAAYIRRGGYEIFCVNALAALVALFGYMIVIPHFGVAGAIAATLAAHCLRLIIMVYRARITAPVPLVSLPSTVVALSALVPVLFIPANVSIIERIGFMLGAPLLVLGCAILTAVIAIPRFKKLSVA